jgi:hypothetical protein
MSEYQQLDGPSFLDAVAQANAAEGLNLNASEYSLRADQWRRDLQTLEVSQAAVDTLQTAISNMRREAARAFDQLSRVRPDSIDAAEYEAVRMTLSAIGDTRFCPPAWADKIDESGRNPRLTPMPGDRYYVPVEVYAAAYIGDGLSITYVPLLRNDAGELEPKRNARFAVLGTSTWAHGAVGVVASPQRAFDACAHLTEASKEQAA